MRSRRWAAVFTAGRGATWQKPATKRRHGKRLIEVWATGGDGGSLTVVYSGRKRTSKVIFLTVGGSVGPWHTADGLIFSSESAAAEASTGCVAYGRNADGSRDYTSHDRTEFEACEKAYGSRRWFYVGFIGATDGRVNTVVGGFSLSTRRVP